MYALSAFYGVLALIATAPIWGWLWYRSAARDVDDIVRECRRTGTPLPWTPKGRAYWAARRDQTHS